MKTRVHVRYNLTVEETNAYMLGSGHLSADLQQMIQKAANATGLSFTVYAADTTKADSFPIIQIYPSH